MKKNKFNSLDHFAILICIVLWGYIYPSVDTGTFYMRAIKFDRLIDPQGFWGMVIFSVVISLICLFLAFFIGDDE